MCMYIVAQTAIFDISSTTKLPWCDAMAYRERLSQQDNPLKSDTLFRKIAF